MMFSDMCNHTKGLNLESQAGIVTAMGRLSAEELPVPDIRSGSVYAFGVDGAGSTTVSLAASRGLLAAISTGVNIAEHSVLRTTSLR
jgi:hypothetical protein